MIVVNRRRTENTITKGQRTNNDPQNTTQKPKDRATRIPLLTESEHRYSGRVDSSSSTSGDGDTQIQKIHIQVTILK
jgi:hypothetical protein